MDRREFLEAAGGGALARAMAAAAPARVIRKLDRIGLQLYTVRRRMEQPSATGVEHTLERVARIGYQEVQFAGYFGRTPRQIRAALDAAGLTSPSAHVPLELLREGWAEALEAAHVMGHRYLLVAWTPVEERQTLDGWRRIAHLFNRAADQARAAGILFAYHNHDFEFARLEGQIPFDVLLAEADADLVKIEMDLFWIIKGGGDPVAYFTRYPGRFHSVHVKDMDGQGRMVDVGQGTIDFAATFARQDQAGIRHFFVEHDSPDDPFASIQRSYGYLRQLEFSAGPG